MAVVGGRPLGVQPAEARLRLPEGRLRAPGRRAVRPGELPHGPHTERGLAVSRLSPRAPAGPPADPAGAVSKEAPHAA